MVHPVLVLNATAVVGTTNSRMAVRQLLSRGMTNNSKETDIDKAPQLAH